MPPIDETPPASPPAAPPPPPAPARALYQSVADVFGNLAGAVFSLTPAQAAEAGDAVRLLAADAPEIAWWGRGPIVVE